MKWNKLFIRNTPLGQVLSSETEGSFETVDSGTIISECQRFMIQPEGNGEWSLVPNTTDAQFAYYNQPPDLFGTFKLNKDLEYLKRICEDIFPQ